MTRALQRRNKLSASNPKPDSVVSAIQVRSVVLVFAFLFAGNASTEVLDQDFEFSRVTEYLCSNPRYLECTAVDAQTCKSDMEAHRPQCADLTFLAEYGEPLLPQAQAAILKCAMISHAAGVQRNPEAIARCFLGK